MKLIADSGSTKTIWYLTNGQDHRIYHTKGYNPFLLSTAEIKGSLKKELLTQLSLDDQQITQIHFYGAGCGSLETQEIVRKILQECFSQAQVNVANDILGTARAVCGQTPGICCISGTGSNACVYDGKQIIDNIVSLGYILGDEGSGNHIAKALIRSYFYETMPIELMQAFEKKYGLSRVNFLNTLFNSVMPSQYLATFSLFCAEKIEHLFIQDLVKKSFEEFVQCHLLPLLAKFPNMAVHFSGSIAYGFRAQLTEILTLHHIKLGKIIKNPFPDLLYYHLTPY